MEFLSETLPSMLDFGAFLAPMFLEQRHHLAEIRTAIALHREAIAQATEIHEAEMKASKKYHDAGVDQSKDLHNRACELSLELHRQQLEFAQRIHEIEKEFSLHLHAESIANQILHHIQGIEIAIETERREHLRDIWSQKSRKADTLMITVTLMFASFIALMIEGLPPTDSPRGMVWAYSATTSLSFSFLLFCMWLTARFQTRMASYDIHDKDVVYLCGSPHKTFEQFYICHCSLIARCANISFYLGTVFLVAAATIVMWLRFKLVFENIEAALIYVIISACSVLILFFFHIAFPGVTSGHREVKDDYDNLRDVLEDLARTIPHEFRDQGFVTIEEEGEGGGGSSNGDGSESPDNLDQMGVPDGDGIEMQRAGGRRAHPGFTTSADARSEAARSRQSTRSTLTAPRENPITAHRVSNVVAELNRLRKQHVGTAGSMRSSDPGSAAAFLPRQLARDHFVFSSLSRRHSTDSVGPHSAPPVPHSSQRSAHAAEAQVSTTTAVATAAAAAATSQGAEGDERFNQSVISI
eukprot:m.142078 g.142078  ORF g.142078 m.142078 type:complete len:526 (-) comp10034_c0_seq1:433-2010(-)